MAAESFEKFAEEKKLHIKVEKQGAQGTINKITSEDIKNAKMIIIASDKQIEEKDRFENKKIFEVSVANPIKNANKVFKDALKESKIYKISQRKKTLKQAFSSGGAKPMQALMNGVSYMIPFVIVGGILIAVSLGLGGTVVKGEGLKVTKGSF
jgi:fructose-specific phosphotransferase system IIB component